MEPNAKRDVAGNVQGRAGDVIHHVAQYHDERQQCEYEIRGMECQGLPSLPKGLTHSNQR